MRLLVPPAALLHLSSANYHCNNFGAISGWSVAKAFPVTEGLFVHLVSSLLPCAVFSLEPLVHDPSNEIMGLPSCKPVYCSSSPLFCPTPRPETGLAEDTLVRSSEQFTWSKLRSELFAKFCSDESPGAAERFRAGCVCYTCVAGSPSMYYLATYIYF
jgi:hypothetical protein